MSTVAPHVDKSEVVRDHFASNNGVLPAFIFEMDSGELEELLDAFSIEKDGELIDAIVRALAIVRIMEL